MNVLCLLVILMSSSWSYAAKDHCTAVDVKCQKAAMMNMLNRIDPRVFHSCYDIKKYDNGSKDGLYNLESDTGITYQTYCDMATDGGGWTLVASIHENDIAGKCTLGDLWSSQHGNKQHLPEGDGNWANYNIFGSAPGATSDDYKNPGYYDIKAKDLAVWHVPNITPMKDWRSHSIFRYHTETGFLTAEGGNLFKLFQKYPVRFGLATCPEGNGPASPVVFDKGNETRVTLYYPPDSRAASLGGFVQFRVINNMKAVHALCSGVKVLECINYPPCFGGGGYFPEHPPKSCGDFASFDASGYGKGRGGSATKKLTESALLLWYR